MVDLRLLGRRRTRSIRQWYENATEQRVNHELRGRSEVPQNLKCFVFFVFVLKRHSAGVIRGSVFRHLPGLSETRP